MGIFDKDITIDEEAFVKAANDLSALSKDLSTLSGKIQSLLDILSKGFDTPCGTKFYNSCEANLLRPLDDRRLVRNHISQTLNDIYGERRRGIPDWNYAG